MAGELQLDPRAESEARVALRSHFDKLKYWNAPAAVEFSMSLDGPASRFAYLAALLPPELFRASSRALISGTAAGSEMLVARKCGFGEVHGTEVEETYVDICRKRFRGSPGLYPVLYDGRTLPYGSGFFDLVVSGHIIEHTEDPFAYLGEHLRVLKKGGFLYLEFPTRFHHTELHTNLPSFEWLPTPLRDASLRTLGSRLSPLPTSVKTRYNTIVDTRLKQISLGKVRRWLGRIDPQARMLDSGRAARGVIRSITVR